MLLCVWQWLFIHNFVISTPFQITCTARVSFTATSSLKICFWTHRYFYNRRMQFNVLCLFPHFGAKTFSQNSWFFFSWVGWWNNPIVLAFLFRAMWKWWTSVFLRWSHPGTRLGRFAEPPSMSLQRSSSTGATTEPSTSGHWASSCASYLWERKYK